MQTVVKSAPKKPVERLGQKHLEHALGQLALEGLRPSSEALADMQQVVAGKMTREQYGARVKMRYGV